MGGGLPEPLSDFVVFPALGFAGLSLLGMVWLPRPFLPRWYIAQMGLECGSTRKKAAISGSRMGHPPSRGPLGEVLGGDAEKGVHGRTHEPRRDGRLRG
ncbi:hypothetical protein AWH51_04535 [Clavibacter tessellarius]|uniref:Uncharacterized protein n=1 Tax=Clavibacter tessellarius TaxID=31965 RepID=A0A154V3W4_9MICO|nr:hypothetical protein AWH51_04535 [Clavibacter michiganensis subsp. tessellarius]